jgi:NAD(P) transhydrogenase subunit alpha
MILGVLKESGDECRVAILPEHVDALKKIGFSDVWVEEGAGDSAYKSDSDYSASGASIKSRQDILGGAKVIVGMQLPETSALGKDAILISQMNPLGNINEVEKLATDGITVFSMDMVPRTTKAQAMDVLSSMATASGYKAVLMAAAKLPSFFPMFMTAAGTITPAKVLILGAGVAGLQAIATAKRLGAVVHAFDVRAAAKEEVLSLGAKFVEVEGATDDTSAGGYAVEQTEEYKQRQAALIQEFAKKSDVIICTAQIPGRRAPLLIQEDTLKEMKLGSVIVDLAASTGGNCARTENGATIVVNGVTIIGDSDIPSSIPLDASKMYGKNLINFFKEVIVEGAFSFDFENEIIQHTCITHGGQVVSPRVQQKLESEKS